ncbi:MAG: hypothetical protein AUH72_17295 [Acidobacteria bacterium 13_1_40CM_4_65_8]|nr:MAG: hypothetical protein AUH72_17295 [Acidobacteria bacterium 13_1_40CM_4_65_8]
MTFGALRCAPLTQLYYTAGDSDDGVMDDSLQTQRDVALAHLKRLIARGRQIADRLKTIQDSAVDIRAWQQDVATAINELSGGSKAHWLSRAFSQAFLVRPADGGVVIEASAADIVDRLLAVLAQAAASLTTMDPVDAAAVAATAAPAPRRFDFVHTPELRGVLEQAYADSGRALEAGDVHVHMTMSRRGRSRRASPLRRPRG